MMTIAPERAFELALIELVEAYWPEGGVVCPPLRAGRDDRDEGGEDEADGVETAALVVECVRAARQAGNSGALIGEADVFLQVDIKELSQAEVDAITGALAVAIGLIEPGLRIEVEAARDYPGFVVETFGQVEMVSHGPEAEDPAGGRMRRDGVKVVVGFGLVVGEMAPARRLSFTLSDDEAAVMVFLEGVPVSVGQMRVLEVLPDEVLADGYLLVKAADAVVGKVRLTGGDE